MIKNKMAFLGAAATLGVMGGAFVSPAQAVAIRYDISGGAFTPSGSLTGYFSYDASTSTYSDFNITSTSITLAPATAPLANPFTYTSASAELVSSSSTAFKLNAPNGTAFPYRELRLVFATGLNNLNIGDNTNFVVDTRNPANASYELYAEPGQNLTGAVSGGIVTAVPWETDALSVIGVTTLFGFGVWTKRKRKVDLSK